jgi:hypothetical protein
MSRRDRAFQGWLFFLRSSFSGNGRPRGHEKEDVEPLDQELLAVAESLCEVAAAFLILGAVDRAACHLEQASDLLAERAVHLAVRRNRGELVELQ